MGITRYDNLNSDSTSLACLSTKNFSLHRQVGHRPMSMAFFKRFVFTQLCLNRHYGEDCLYKPVPLNSLKQGLYPGTRTLTYSRLTTEQTPYFQEHLNHIFSPLHFPKELAKRILTHGSHSASIGGHNAALSFIGVCVFFFDLLNYI